ncbi:MAG TPA: hypothetical protein VKX49_02475 [Bryobacteraceae bacterium]|nr:hypothetical protein [Bryobacteraceae bacterium]
MGTTSRLRYAVRPWKLHRVWLVAAAICGFAHVASADLIDFSGVITQSTSDGTGPAVNNTELNHINDGDTFTVTLNILGSVSSTGTFTNFTSALFSDPAATPTPANESSFGSISLTILPDADGTDFDLSLLACLTTGTSCAVGNELDANFKIPIPKLQSQNVAAQTIPGLVPSMDLLEDDGVTVIQGTVTGYTYTGAGPGTSAVPEPSTVFFVLALLVWISLRSRHARMSSLDS